MRGEPALLLLRGVYLDDALAKERVTRDETLAAVRAQGVAHVDEVEAAVLETDDSISAVRRGTNTPSTALVGIDSGTAVITTGEAIGRANRGTPTSSHC